MRLPSFVAAQHGSSRALAIFAGAVAFSAAVAACSADPGASSPKGSAAPGPEAIAPAPSLAIEPPVATVEVLNGVVVAPLEPFHAVAHAADGSTIDAGPVTWSIDLPRVGAIDASGAFTPSGSLGGVVTVSAEAAGAHATASLTVKLHLVDAPSLDPTVLASLRGAADGLAASPASHDPAVAWAYPYDGTVFPRGLAAPTLMWNGGADDDLYYFHVASPTYELESLLSLKGEINETTPPRRFALPATRWTQLTESTSGRVDLTVARATSGGAIGGVVRHAWTIAPARLPGTIYYWTMKTATGSNAGRMRALDLKTGAARDFLGDYRPNGTEGCPKCHTPSADGRRMSLVMYDRSSNLGQGTESISYDIAGGTTSFASYLAGGSSWGGAAMSARGEVIVPNFASIRGTLGLAKQPGAFDATNGGLIPNSGLDTLRAWMPSFSPDDKMLVYVAETPPAGQTACDVGSGQGPEDVAKVKACASDLRAFDWDPKAKRATNDRRLVAKGTDPKAEVIQFPSVSPSHELVVYGRGAELGSIALSSYSPGNPGQLVGNPGDLYAVHPSAPDQEVPLVSLGGGSYPLAAGVRDLHLDYDASFAPIEAGGYYWVVFVSRRTYGNMLTGAPFLGETVGGVKQMWVAAIDPNAPPGKDPSHPAFWLPGQDMSPTDTGVINQRPRWTLSPCLDEDDACEVLP